MKKYLIILALYSALNASTDFNEALKLFNSGDFQKSYQIFHKLSENGIVINDLDFYLGRSAFEVGRYKEAFIAFDRVLIEADEDDKQKINRVKLELARTYLALGERESAKKLFNEVLADNPPQIVKDRIQTILEESNKDKEKSSRWNLFASFEAGYEENVNSQPSIDKLREFTKNSNLQSETVDSLYLQEMGGVGFSYLFNKSGFSINSNLFAFNQNYFENDNYDIRYFAFGLSPVYRVDRNRFEIPLKAENVNYGGENLLNATSIGFKASRFIETKYIKAIVFEFFTNYKYKNYESSRDELDSNIFEYGLSTKIKYKNNYLALRYSTENESSKNSVVSGTNQTDKIINSIQLKYDRENIGKGINLSFAYLFKNFIYDDYRAKASIDDSKNSFKARKDRYHSLKIDISKEIMKSISLNLGYNYIISTSNYTPVEYDKNIISFGASYSF